MPLVRIDLPAGKTPEYQETVVGVVYDALTAAAGAPVGDKFMVLSEHQPATLVMDPHYVVDRTADALIIQITLNAGRTVQVKKDLYRAIADGLHTQLGMRTDDVFINLIEVAKENWSFGAGEAQYAE